jgi:hypothetical protein
MNKRYRLFFFFLVLWNATAGTPPSGGSRSAVSADIERAYAPFDSLKTSMADYVWPTLPLLPVTSSFADFRSTHFHGGIDISTHGKTGLPVFASRSGYISHISVSENGYGKMLCIRHIDGFCTRYAHLKRFNEAVEAYVRRIQYANGVYPLEKELQPGELVVDQFELIAYTGNTGAGDAHLHFEILDGNMNPVNPLLFPAFERAANDRCAPHFRQIAFTPMDANSGVFGSTQTFIADAEEVSEHEFRVTQKIFLHGKIGISVHATDVVGRSGYSNQANRYDCFLDGGRIFSSDILRFPQREYKQIAMHYDWTMYRNGDVYFQKMYLEPGNRLPFYNRLPAESGVIETDALEAGSHDIRIVAGDLEGNSSSLTCSFLCRTPGQKAIENGLQRPAASRSNRELLSDEEEDPSSPSISFSARALKTASLKSSNSLRLQKAFSQDFMTVAAFSHLPFTIRPSVWITTSSRHVLLDISLASKNRYEGTFSFRPEDRGRVRIEAHADINGARDVEASEEFELFPVSSSSGDTIVSPDSMFTISFSPDAVYQTLYCRIEKTPDGYSVQPADVLLNEGSRITYLIPGYLRSHHIGLFESTDFGTSLLDCSAPNEKKILTGRSNRLLGDYVLAADDMPPQISAWKISTIKHRLRFSFHIRDNISGVNANSMRITLDGETIIAEYAEKYARVSFDEPMMLPHGAHTFNITAADRMGNSAIVEKTFFVR